MPVDRYRRKPVVVEGFQITADNAQDVADWCGAAVLLFDTISVPMVPTGTGLTPAYPGDTVVRGIDGTYSVETPTSMAATYELYTTLEIEEVEA